MTADDGRGAGALIAAARSVRVLNRMQAAEVSQLGIPDDERRRYFRTDGGKQNMAPPGGKGVWRYLASQSLGNGNQSEPADEVGVVIAWEKPAVGSGLTSEHVTEIRRLIRVDGAKNRRSEKSPEWVGFIAGPVLGIDVNLKGAKPRVTALVDLMIQRGALIAETRKVNGRDADFVVAAEGYTPVDSLV